MNTQKMPIVGGIILFIVAATIVAYFSSGRGIQVADIFTGATTTEVSAQTRSVPYGWREYRNTAYRFSLLYPQGLEVKEYPEKGNALTITFQNVKEQKGFQLFIVPYQEPQVSEERFQKDLPSGVRIGTADMVIDGATAAAFYSENAMLGETREIWFVHEGFLYEATTLKPLGAWLDDAMRTWKFF